VRDMYFDPKDTDPRNLEDWEEVIFDPVQKRKVRGLRHLWGRALSTFAAVNLPCSVLPLFLCFSSIYQVAIGVFFGENTFRLGIRHGEADWDMLSDGWRPLEDATYVSSDVSWSYTTLLTWDSTKDSK
jgi:hypothetical protein